MSWQQAFSSYDSQLSPSSFSSGSSQSHCSSPAHSPESNFSSWVPVNFGGIKQEPGIMESYKQQEPHRKGSRRRVHVPHSQRPKEFVVKRNARERRRVEAVNDAFHILEETIPTMRGRSVTQRVSKAGILRGAIDYIQQLHMMLGIPNQTGSVHDEYYDNNQNCYAASQNLTYSVYDNQQSVESAPSPYSAQSLPSPTSSIEENSSLQNSWSQQEQQQVVELLDSVWNTMNIEDFPANVALDEFDL